MSEVSRPGSAVRPFDTRLFVWLALLVIVSAGSYFRLARLNDSALQMDNYSVFWMPCATGATGFQMLTHWDMFGQLPLPVAVTQFVLQSFHLPLTFGNLILPSALWGIATIIVAFFAGREARGALYGLVLSGLVAFNPFYVQMSREAYVYPPLILGGFLSLWCGFAAWRYFHAGRGLPVALCLGSVAGVGFMVHSSSSAWPVGGLFGLFFVTIPLLHSIRSKRFTLDLLLVAGLLFLLGLPLLTAPWGVRAFLESPTEATQHYWKTIFEQDRAVPLLGRLAHIFMGYAWGATPGRVFFALLMTVLGLLSLTICMKQDKRWRGVAALFCLGLALNLASVFMSVFGVQSRYVATLSPILMMVLALGMLAPVVWLSRHFGRASGLAGQAAEASGPPVGSQAKSTHLRRGVACRRPQTSQAKSLPGLGSNHAMEWAARALAAVLISVGVGLWLGPDAMAVNALGKTTPYRVIVGFLDTTLSPGTPVFTERFFTAFNEYRLHVGTNVIFTSAVHNEIPEIYRNNRFRERMVDLMHEFPVSGYIEERHLWFRPNMDAWLWPHSFYAHYKVFADPDAVALDRLGLNYRAEAGVSNDLSVTVYYNLPEDVLAMRKADGARVTCLAGEGWKYVKTQDLRDWRLMGDQAVVRAYNLTSAPLHAALVLNAAAAGGTKRVRTSAGGLETFANGQLTEWKLEPMTLPPGETVITLSDTLGVAAKVPLLVGHVGIEEVKP